MKFSKKLYFFPFLTVILILITMTSLPSNQIPDLEIFQFDKIIHIIAYFCFGLTLIFLLHGYFSLSLSKIYVYNILIGFFFGMIDELHQIFIPGRSCSIFDWIADVVGILLSLLFIKYLRSLVEKINESIF